MRKAAMPSILALCGCLLLLAPGKGQRALGQSRYRASLVLSDTAGGQRSEHPVKSFAYGLDRRLNIAPGQNPLGMVMHVMLVFNQETALLQWMADPDARRSVRLVIKDDKGRALREITLPRACLLYASQSYTPTYDNAGLLDLSITPAGPSASVNGVHMKIQPDMQ